MKKLSLVLIMVVFLSGCMSVTMLEEDTEFDDVQKSVQNRRDI